MKENAPNPSFQRVASSGSPPAAAERKRQAMHLQPILQSVLTCPQCGFVATEAMPTDACLYLYECANCHVLLRPKAGDCCVFCSYGSVRCPPIQRAGGCCVDSSTSAGSQSHVAASLRALGA